MARLPAALAIVAPDGTIVHWNRAAERLFGYGADEATGRDFESLLVPADRREDARDALRNARAAGSACFVTERLTRDGTPIEVRVFLDLDAADASGMLFVTQRASGSVSCRCDAAVTPADRRPTKELTTRQLQVLRLIAEGRSTRDIASRLGLSAKTVETHRGHLMQRLRLRSVAGLVRYAVSVGLVPSSPWASRGKDG